MNSSLLTAQEIQTIAYYDNHASEWAAKRKKTTEHSFWHDEYQVFKQLQTPQGKILEIGSGTGREATELIAMGYEYVGVDASTNLLEIAQKTNPALQLYYSTAYDLPFPKETFNAFSSWAMLPHVPKKKINAALFSIRGVLKQGAVGFIAMREGKGEKQEMETGRWFSYYQEEEFTNLLQERGFRIEQIGKKISRIDLVWLTFFVRAI